MILLMLKLILMIGLGWLTAPSCAIETDVLMRIADNATNQFMRSDEDMKKWYKTYYEAMNKFYKAKPELICPGPEELIDMLEDLEDQIEKIRDCRSEKEEQMKVLQNITAAMNHNSTMVQELEGTMGNLTLNAQTEDEELRKQEDELLKLKQEVENFKCDCEYEEWSDNWGPCSKDCVPDDQAYSPPVKNRTRGIKWEARNNGAECVDADKIEVKDCQVCEQDNCEVKFCPVNCEWGTWEDWPPCTDECGIHERKRFRTMYEHRHGGLPCEGSGHETEECNAWLDTKTDLLACQAKSENLTTEVARLKPILTLAGSQLSECNGMIANKNAQILDLQQKIDQMKKWMMRNEESHKDDLENMQDQINELQKLLDEKTEQTPANDTTIAGPGSVITDAGFESACYYWNDEDEANMGGKGINWPESKQKLQCKRRGHTFTKGRNNPKNCPSNCWCCKAFRDPAVNTKCVMAMDGSFQGKKAYFNNKQIDGDQVTDSGTGNPKRFNFITREGLGDNVNKFGVVDIIAWASNGDCKDGAMMLKCETWNENGHKVVYKKNPWSTYLSNSLNVRVKDGVMCPGDTQKTQALFSSTKPWIQDMAQAGGQAVWGRKTNYNKLRRFLISPNDFE